MISLALAAAIAVPTANPTLVETVSVLPQTARTTPYTIEEQNARLEIIDMCRKLEDNNVMAYMCYPSNSVEGVYVNYKDNYLLPLKELEDTLSLLDKYEGYIPSEHLSYDYLTHTASQVRTSLEKAKEVLSAAKVNYDKAKEEEARKVAEEAVAKATYVGNSSGLTKAGGVNYYNGRKETYYSSRVLYHYRTSEWYLDSEGFYRTAEGYYVVAASDLPQGTVVEGSKGLCCVLDSGCAAGVLDYYVSW